MRRIQYDSQEALDEINTVMTIINEAAVKTTRELANERGVFPHWEGSVYAANGDKRRNAFLTSVAPTGDVIHCLFPILHTFLVSSVLPFSLPPARHTLQQRTACGLSSQLRTT